MFSVLDWSDFWSAIGAGFFLLAISAIFSLMRLDPKRDAETFKWRGHYPFGNTKSWELRYKILRVGPFIIGLLFLLWALVILLYLLVT